MNRSARDATHLEIGDRTGGYAVTYPDDDLDCRMEGGTRKFFRRDGTPY